MQVERFGVIGETTLKRKDGSAVPVTVTSEPDKSEKSGRIYRVINASNEELGKMTTHVNSYTDKPDSAWVEIDRLYNHTKNLGEQKVANIGKLLVRYAVMQSLLLKHEGRIQTTASDKSHFFYWSIGMRPVENKVFASEEAASIYDKLLKNQPLDDLEATVLPVFKRYAMEEKGKSEAELTPEDICFIDLSKRMQKTFDRAVAKKQHATYGNGSLRMHMPLENIPRFLGHEAVG